MWHKKRVVSVFVSLALIAALLLPTQAHAARMAVTLGVDRYYGEIFIGGVHPTTPQVVSAWINGVKYAETTSGSIQGQSVWEFLIDVPPDDPGTVPIEGGMNGDTILFKIAGFNATPTSPF